MSNWQGFKRTKLGQNLQAKIDAGLTKFKITKLGIGDGSYQGNVENMIALSNKKQDLNVSKIEVSENVIKIQTTITNTGVTEKYQMTEIGIFAMDPEMGEILYAVMTDPNPDTMPAAGSATVVKKTWTFNLIVDNTGDVSAVIDSTSLITVGDLANHNNDTNAHAALAATIDDTNVPTSDTNTIRNLVSNLANRIKAATGAGGWKEAPAATLASLSKMFANLATGADVTWDGKKFTNHRLGITGLMDQNGYICFGPNCGNLIIQWGNGYGYSDPDTNNASYYIKYPIVMDKVLIGLSQVSSEVNADIYVRFIKKNGKFFLLDTDSSNDNIPCEWIVLGYVK
jgi:hypothetical protein